MQSKTSLARRANQHKVTASKELTDSFVAQNWRAGWWHCRFSLERSIRG